ncbi:ABC transporter permease, partial [Rhodovulum sulfidophilum]|nr:ABC transporter permease [Rhodovulum sulfidophilum]
MRLEPVANPSTLRRAGLPAVALLATIAVASGLAAVAG